MKNYYEILEVDVKASKEIIDKAFKILAKRYHPDTQPEDKKKWAEDKFKELNEAYEILSNEEARKNYDIELDYEENSMLEALVNKNEELKSLVIELQNELEYEKERNLHFSQSHGFNYNFTNETMNNKTNIGNINNNIAQNNSYTYYRPNNTYNKKSIKYNKENLIKDFIAFIITIFCIIAIGFLLWKIPFTNKILVNLYTENQHIKAVVDMFLKIFIK